MFYHKNDKPYTKEKKCQLLTTQPPKRSHVNCLPCKQTKHCYEHLLLLFQDALVYYCSKLFTGFVT